MSNLVIRHDNIPANVEDLSKFVLIGREKMTAVRAEIRAIDKLNLADDVRRQKLEEAQMISEAVLDAEVRLGELTAKIPKATAFNNPSGVSKTAQNDSGVELGSPKPKTEVVRELGFTPKQVERFEQLAKHPEVVEAAKAEARENEDIVSRSLVLNKIKMVAAEEKRDAVIANLEDLSNKEAKAISGVYDAIVLDPPWPMQKIERDVRPNQTAFDYPTMSEEELASLKIPCAENCHVWVWTTQKFLPMAFRLLGTWGLKYVCMFVWHKPGGFQPIGLPQYNCEFLLYARKGAPQFVDTKAFPTCFTAPRGVHSEKPEEFYDIVRRVTAGRRLDMFNRRGIDGFDVWGNEAQ